VKRARPGVFILTAVLSAAVSALTAIAAPSPDGVLYRVTAIEAVPGLGGEVTAINDRGDVVGQYTLPSRKTPHAFLWSRGRFIDLGTLGGTDSMATGVNDRLQVCGFSTTPSGVQHAFLWYRGRMKDLGTLGGRKSQAWAINQAGDVAGNSDVYPNEKLQDAFLYQHGKMTDLGSLALGGSEEFGLNSRGEVVGISSDWFGNEHPFLYRRGHMMDLGTAGKKSCGSVYINNSGEIVGALDGSSSLYEHGSWRVLKVLKGPFGPGWATGINNRGVIWGTDIDSHGNQVFFLDHGRNRPLRYLPGSGWDAFMPWAMNDAGEVVGWAHKKTGYYPVVGTPVAAKPGDHQGR